MTFGQALGSNYPEGEADRSPPHGAYSLQCLELNLHATYTRSLRGA
jgi:hypothetical protein